MDAIDWTILNCLQRDATVSNKVLAAKVGIAPSTCLLRIRRLRDAGVITGFHAHISPARIGLGLDAILAVQVRPHAHEVFARFVEFALSLPEITALFHISGAQDFHVHVSVTDSGHLQRLVLDVMSQRSEVVHVHSSIVYESVQLPTVQPPDPRSGERALIAPRLKGPHRSRARPPLVG